jgi:DNA polymerase III delta prime subunit
MSKHLTEIFGHTSLIKNLEALRNLKKLPQALLIIGPEQTGKFTIAQALANQINDNILDQHIINEEGTIKIEQIRKLIEQLSLSPIGSARLVIIKNIDKLTREAANCLLKSLEEPASFTKFILTSSQEFKIPETIRSRCQIFYTKDLTITDLIAFKKTHFSEQSVSDTELLLSLKRPGRLHKLLTDKEFNTNSQELLKAITTIFNEKNLEKALAFSKELSTEKNNLQLFFEILESFLRFSDPSKKTAYWAGHTKLVNQFQNEIKQNQNQNLVLDQMFIELFQK